jgi:hypothetical protein
LWFLCCSFCPDLVSKNIFPSFIIINSNIFRVGTWNVPVYLYIQYLEFLITEVCYIINLLSYKPLKLCQSDCQCYVYLLVCSTIPHLLD